MKHKSEIGSYSPWEDKIKWIDKFDWHSEERLLYRMAYHRVYNIILQDLDYLITEVYNCYDPMGDGDRIYVIRSILEDIGYAHWNQTWFEQMNLETLTALVDKAIKMAKNRRKLDKISEDFF